MVLSISQTWQHFKQDLARRLILEDKSLSFLSALSIVFNRGVISVLIYRLNRYLYFKHSFLCKVLIRLLRYIEFQYCHNEIEPNAVIGPGLVLSDFGGVGISHVNVIGENVTFLGKATPTLGAMEDVEAGVDKIKIGDYCVIGPNVRIVNNVEIAKGVQMKANSVIMSSITREGTVVSGFPAKQISHVTMETVMSWSPLLSKKIK